MAHTDQFLDDYKFSPSQITTGMSCTRKWGFTYMLNIRGTPTEAQARGTRTHSQIERYLKGEDIDFTTEEGEIVASGLEHLPRPSPDLNVESEFHLKSRHHWWGFKDIERNQEVWDNKTTSDLKWAKTEQDLMYDPQAVVYAVDNGSDPVDLRWIYYQTKGTRRSKVTHLKMYQEHAQKAFAVLEDEADRLLDIARGGAGLDGDPLRAYVLALPHNASHCEAFRGCQFRGLCNLSPAERFQSKMSQAKGVLHMSLFDRMKKANAADDAKPLQSINPPESTAESAPAQAADEGLKTDYAAEQARQAEADAKAAKAAKAAAKKAAKAAEPPPPSQLEMPSAPAVSAPATAPPLMTLYVDCAPFNSRFTAFDDLVVKAHKRIQESLGLDDYRFAEYGQGPGIFKQAMVQLLDEGVLDVVQLVVDTKTPETQICLATLRARANNIVVSIK